MKNQSIRKTLTLIIVVIIAAISIAAAQKGSDEFTLLETKDIITDDTDPTISCPENITVSNETGIFGAEVNFTSPKGSDNCSGAITIQTTGFLTGSVFPIGTTTNTFVVTDASGNTANCSFNVTVIDNEDPVINGCPVDTIITNDEGCNSVVFIWTAPVASDNNNIADFTATHNPGDSFPIGETTVVYTAIDDDENETTCSFVITVKSSVNAGGDATIDVYETDEAFYLIDVLEGDPDEGGFWLVNENIEYDGIFDPAIDLAGVYSYVVEGLGSCENDTSTVTISITKKQDTEKNIKISVSDNNASIDFFELLEENAEEGGLWTGPADNKFKEVFILESDVMEIDAFPNPNNGKFGLKIDNTKNNILELEVVNSSGNIVYKEALDNNQIEILKQIDISNYSKGVYFIKINTKEGVAVKKVLVY